MTPTQLEVAALLALRWIAAGDTPEAVDSEAMGDGYSRWYAEFSSQNVALAYWNEDENIPDEVADAVVLLVAHRMTRDFPIPPTDMAALDWRAVDRRNPDAALARLKKMCIAVPEPRAGTPTNSRWTHF